MNRKLISWVGMGVIAAVMAVLFVVGIAINRSDMRALTVREAELSYVLSQTQARELELEAEKNKTGSREDIERRARTEYGFMQPGELRFRVENEELLANYTLDESQVITNELYADVE